MELRLRRRKPGETLSALHQDIRKLMALHPTLPREARESIACDYYIDALDDDEFGLKVRERAPASLARRSVTRLSAVGGMAEGRSQEAGRQCSDQTEGPWLRAASGIVRFVFAAPRRAFQPTGGQHQQAYGRISRSGAKIAISSSGTAGI